MWRLTLLRTLIALNWMIAGISLSFVAINHTSAWGRVCAKLEVEDEDAGNTPGRTDQPSGSYETRPGAVLRGRLVALERLSQIGWQFAMWGGAATAISLMIVFPYVRTAIDSKRAQVV
jgi:hypothetical protein